MKGLDSRDLPIEEQIIEPAPGGGGLGGGPSPPGGSSGGSGGGGSGGPGGQPVIQVVNGELPRVLDEAEAALMAAGCEIYQRGGQIVRPVLQKHKASDNRQTEAWLLVPVTRSDLVVMLTKVAHFKKFDGRSKKLVSIDAPDKVAETYLASVGRWRLPILTRVIGTPFLRLDGSVCSRPGYDDVTGLLFKPECQFPPVPERPTKDDALRAIAELEEPIKRFPFVTEADRSVQLSGFLTALDRHNLPTAPMHDYTAPVAGTGKSKLVDLISILATGRDAPVIGQGNKEEDLEKHLGAELLQGSSIISIDNCDHLLQSAFLCRMLSQRTVSIRVLGLSKSIETSTASFLSGNGNNLRIAGDLTRRSLRSSLNAKMENPEQREFDADAVDLVRASRGRLVVAALTVILAYQLSGEAGPKPLGGYEVWSRRIRGALVWLGLEDPCKTTEKVKKEDPRAAELTAVLEAWKDWIGIGVKKTAGDIIKASDRAEHQYISDEEAQKIGRLRSALMTVAAGRTGGVSSERLGKWLSSVKERPIGGLWIEEHPTKVHGQAIWVLAVVR
jgi:putative DNA primase/helicase